MLGEQGEAGQAEEGSDHRYHSVGAVAGRQGDDHRTSLACILKQQTKLMSTTMTNNTSIKAPTLFVIYFIYAEITTNNIYIYNSNTIYPTLLNMVNNSFHVL